MTLLLAVLYQSAELQWPPVPLALSQALGLAGAERAGLQAPGSQPRLCSAERGNRVP